MDDQDGYRKCEKTYTNFLGISKKESPGWNGWKIIAQYRSEGIPAKQIEDPVLETLVENYYYLLYLEMQDKKNQS